MPNHYSDTNMKQLLTKDGILARIKENPHKSSKASLAKAMSLDEAGIRELRLLLKEMISEGRLVKRGRTYKEASGPSGIKVKCVIRKAGAKEIIAEPIEWRETAKKPSIKMRADITKLRLKPGDEVLVQVTDIASEGPTLRGRAIKKLRKDVEVSLGVFCKREEAGFIISVEKGLGQEWIVQEDITKGALDGELVRFELLRPGKNHKKSGARIVECLGAPFAPKSVSLIAIHKHRIPHRFSSSAIREAEMATAPTLGSRRDLRDIPFVTIDPDDARDHDDAVWACPDEDPSNAGGYIVWVAIADVAEYVGAGSRLDKEAFERGNSNYFPDRVVPMLPDRLSGDLCSLNEGVDRACIAVKLRIDASGVKIDHKFVRGLMRSTACLSYDEVQSAIDGSPNDKCSPLLESVIRPLFSAWRAVENAKKLRQPLAIELPERKIQLSNAGEVLSVDSQRRFAAHQLIEDLMVLANVSAAEELEKRQAPVVYRVHDRPSNEKIEALRQIVSRKGLYLPKSRQLGTPELNQLLEGVQDSRHAEAVHMATLRSMMQAYYHTDNIGHFGLSLERYARFTSPIRRYSDLLIHRSLIAAHGWGHGALTSTPSASLDAAAEQLSQIERRSVIAERETSDRYLACFLAERVGMEFGGQVSGVQPFGLFIRLTGIGADGLVGVRTLGREFFRFDQNAETLTGSDSGRRIEVGQKVIVKLIEANRYTGGILLELLSIEGKSISSKRQLQAGATRRLKKRSRRHRPS